MRLLTLRLTISLIVGITLISLFSSYYEVRFQKRGLRRDLEHRAEVLGDSLADKVEPYLKKGSRKELQIIVDQFGNREHLAGVAIYNAQGKPIATTPDLVPRLTSEPAVVQQAATNGQSAGQFIRLGEASVYIYAVPLRQDEAVVGGLAIVHDASYINAQSRRIWRETFLRVLVLVFLITLTTLLIVRWSIAGPIARAAQWMRALRMGKTSFAADRARSGFVPPPRQRNGKLRRKSHGGSFRSGEGSPVAPDCRCVLDGRTTLRPRSQQTGKQPPVRGCESRTLYTSAPGQGCRGDRSRQWTGHRSRPGLVRL